MLDIAFAALGGLALVVGLTSRRLRHWPISEPLLALLLGVVLGPRLLGVLSFPGGDHVALLETAARLVLAISLMAVALRFPLEEIRQRLGALVLLTGVTMLAMSAISAGLVAWLVGLELGAAAVIGACLAPTDPVLASSLVEGEPARATLSRRLRVLLSIESGANDVLAFPLVVVASTLALGQGAGPGLRHSLYALAIGVVVGVPFGWLAGRLVSAADEHHELEHTAFLVLTLALALLVLGVVRLAGGEGILGVFAAGLAYNHAITTQERQEEWEVQEAINRFLVLPVFTIFGAMLPWAQWAGLGWRGAAVVTALLFLRRIPAVLALHRPLRLDLAESVFLGWFGPIGVAALYYLTQAAGDGALDTTGWAAGTLAVAASTLVHGITGAPGRNLLGRAEKRSRETTT